MTDNGRVIHELNYVTANRFYVEMESEIKASFTECQGLGLKIKRENYFEGGLNDQQRVILGQTEFTDVTLKRGLTDNFAFVDWISEMLSQIVVKNPAPSTKPAPPFSRRNINILVFNQAGDTQQCWTLIGAIPIGWKAPALQATSNAIAIEELTLAYEGLKIAHSGSSGGKAIKVERRAEAGHYFL